MPDAQPKPTAAERAAVIVEAHQRTSQGMCSADHPRDQFIDSGVPMWTPEHVVHMLAAAGLLVTADRAPGDVLLSLVESGLGWDRARAMLAEHDAQVAAGTLRGVAEAWTGGPTGEAPIPKWFLTDCADRIAAGGES